MAVPYMEYDFTVTPVSPGTDILIAQLNEIGFESYEETDYGVKAYIPQEADLKELAKKLPILSNSEFEIKYDKQAIAPINWNEEWEKNFDPIEVDGKCTVRAPFHHTPDTEFDIIIEPKMSFGTGHHETTHLMIKHILKLHTQHKSVLDMGCGTGVLAILAALKGAKDIDAIDIDPWCYENTIENATKNNCAFINVKEGDVAAINSSASYDLIIANINRNILLNDIDAYAKVLKPEGILLLSGFYTEDIPAITAKCNTSGLNFIMNFEKNNWVACKFVKN